MKLYIYSIYDPVTGNLLAGGNVIAENELDARKQLKAKYASNPIVTESYALISDIHEVYKVADG